MAMRVNHFSIRGKMGYGFLIDIISGRKFCILLRLISSTDKLKILRTFFILEGIIGNKSIEDFIIKIATTYKTTSILTGSVFFKDQGA